MRVETAFAMCKSHTPLRGWC